MESPVIEYDDGEVHIAFPMERATTLESLIHVLFEQGATLRLGVPTMYAEMAIVTLLLNPRDRRSIEDALRYITGTTLMMLNGPA